MAGLVASVGAGVQALAEALGRDPVHGVCGSAQVSKSVLRSVMSICYDLPPAIGRDREAFLRRLSRSS